MRYSEEFIEKVREANNLVDEVAQYSQLRATGGQHMGICPLPSHAENSPSFSVSEAKQVYHCFGCNGSGNIFTFIKEVRGYGFVEAVEYLAGKAGIPLPEKSVSGVSIKKKKLKDQMLEINKSAMEFFSKNLRELNRESEVFKYIISRGLTPEIIKTFSVGYASEEWEDLKSNLLEKKHHLDTGQSVGLVKKKKTGNGYFDIFRGRLMFPILSVTGDVLGFGGRTLTGDVAKYVNSPESEVFHKSKTLYGLFETSKHIRTKDFVILVEGYMDLVALYQNDIKNSAATLGTALTLDHSKVLSRITKNVVILFDGDKAGRAALVRSLPILLGAGMYPKALILPDNQDPDDYLKEHGKESLAELITSAPDGMEWYLSELFNEFGSGPTEKIKIIDKLAGPLLAIQDRRLFGLYVQSISQRLDVKPDWLAAALKNAEAVTKNYPARGPRPGQLAEQVPKNITKIDPEVRKIDISKAPKVETYLLNLALLDSDSFDQVIEEEFLEQFSHKGIVSILKMAKEIRGQMPNKFDSLSALLVEHVEPASKLNLHFDPIFTEGDDKSKKRLFNDCVQRLNRNYLKQKAKDLSLQIKSGSDKVMPEKLKQLMNVHIEKKSIDTKGRV